ncbi:MAG: tRNA pseudouridine(55) synthase TruB [Eubacteriales bacterium]|nr:tRNA pseudouridine(55) synthase TruB [Eubacteriales bacterium]
MTRSGIINIYKEEGMTSHDVVGKVRRIIGERRVGHTGTLDPMATGVLPVCVGRAARVMQYLDLDKKRYRCRMSLGRRSDSLDAWGNFTEEAAEDEINAITEDDIRTVLAKFSGNIVQRPPAYSAVKVGGKRLYELVHKGKEVKEEDIPLRKIHIYSLDIVSMDLGKGFDSNVIFDVECSKGTFIRTICDDAGEMLGTHAYMSGLERTGSGAFSIEDSITLDQLREMSKDEIEAIMKTPDQALENLGRIELSGRDAIRMINGLDTGISRCHVVYEPPYKNKAYCLPINEDYKFLYKLYGKFADDDIIPGRPEGENRPTEKDERGMTFIGIGFLDEDRQEIRPRKMFI